MLCLEQLLERRKMLAVHGELGLSPRFGRLPWLESL